MSPTLTTEEQTFLLATARKSISNFFNKGFTIKAERSSPQFKHLSEIRPCFVLLFLRNQLRGSGGGIEPQDSLMETVSKNALVAAFEDPRFFPLSVFELHKIKIKILLILEIKQLKPKNTRDLLKQLATGKHGLMIKKGEIHSTFLPNVWQTVKDKEQFLTKLCLKAGFKADTWTDLKNVEFYSFETEEFSEN